MTSFRTSEEVRQERIEILGKEFGLLYDSINNDFTWISIKWVEYKQLYSTNESRIEILNQAAPFFFYTIQKVLWENIVLGICRLTDPIETGGRKNATIKALPQFVDNKQLKNEVLCKIKELMDASKFCRDWRNRYISHSDYHLAIDENAKPLEKASLEKMTNIFTLFQELINLFQIRYFNVQTEFGMIESHKGSIALLNVLDEGLEFQKKREKKIRSGKYSDSDLRRKSI